MPLLRRGRARLERARQEERARLNARPRGQAFPASLARGVDPGPGQILDPLHAPRLEARLDPRLDPYLDPYFSSRRDPLLDPVLDPHRAGRLPGRPAPRSGFFETCANPRCGSGWLKLWRSRRAPVFEGGWCCSSRCMRAQVESALSRELDTRSAVAEARPHRIPLGLVLLEQGWLTREQLRSALDAQKAAGAGRLGAWLLRRQDVGEDLLTRALALQWSCPVLGLEFHRPEAMTSLLPRLFVDAFGALPLRVAAGRLLYLGFEDHPDPVLALAVERMTGLRVESGLLAASHFRPAHQRLLAARYPRSGLAEVATDLSLTPALLKAIEQARPTDARLVRVHGCLWLRLWLRPQLGPIPEPDSVEDLICSVSAR